MALDTPLDVRSLVIYQVFPRNHGATGRLADVTADLPRIADLGVDVLYLMPIHPIGELGRKGVLGSPYAIRDYRAINPELGSDADFDELVASAASNLKDNRGTAPQFMVFVSLSMPEQALRQIINETSAAGGFVVFRGFPNNSGKQFIAAMSKVVEKDDQFASIGIDPRLFRAFNITAVPTYVAVSSDFSPCDGLACKTTPPPFHCGERVEPCRARPVPF